jgi:hypothetical protein
LEVSVSRFLSSASVLVLLAACGDDRKEFTYSVDADIVVPEDVARSLEAPSLVEVEWLGEVHQLELICEPLEGEHHVAFSHAIETAGHASHQLLTARVVPWPDDLPCDEALLDAYWIASPHDRAVPYAHVFLFEDEVGFLGAREKDRVESVTIELAYGE